MTPDAPLPSAIEDAIVVFLRVRARGASVEEAVADALAGVIDSDPDYPTILARRMLEIAIRRFQ